MLLRIRHSSRYRFSDPVTYGLQQLRKTPKSSRAQRVVNWSTEVEGGTKELTFEDQHNNTVELISFERDAAELVVSSTGDVEIAEQHGVVGPHIGPAPIWLYRRTTVRTKAGPGVRTMMRNLEGDTELDRLHALSQRIKEAVTYEVGASDASWTAEEAIAEGRGVCQDHTQIFLAAARDLGMPARYVSGYLMLDDRVTQDAMHAWAEVHIDGLGWVGFDVSNGISPDARYVRVATGLDYSHAAPITGTRLGGGGETLSVSIEVAQQ